MIKIIIKIWILISIRNLLQYSHQSSRYTGNTYINAALNWSIFWWCAVCITMVTPVTSPIHKRHLLLFGSVDCKLCARSKSRMITFSSRPNYLHWKTVLLFIRSLLRSCCSRTFSRDCLTWATINYAVSNSIFLTTKYVNICHETILRENDILLKKIENFHFNNLN